MENREGKEISNWWRGRGGLKTAEYNLRGDMLTAAAFYSQQAAEKGLKALQIKKLKRFEKTHDLVLLAKRVSVPAEMVQICEDLAPFYTITRYPDVKIRVDKEIVSSVVEKSRKVLEWVRVDPEVMELLRKFKESAVKKYGAEKIVLFGSYATGAAKKSSDIDLIVVCGRGEKLKMLSKLYHEWYFVQGIDRQWTSSTNISEEFQKLSRVPTIVREAVREGVVV